MKRETITAENLRTICWVGNDIIDRAAGQLYSLTGEQKSLGVYYAFGFDRAIMSPDRQYTFIYQNLGTKGLLLKNGKEIREINRSYYWAEAFEYPAAFVTVEDITYLLHCPSAYNRLDFENVETGKLVASKKRKPSDIFHSRLEVSPTNTFMISKGWLWHPLDVTEGFNIIECLSNTKLLDKSNIKPPIGVKICTASFIDGSRALIGTSGEVYDDEISDVASNHIAVWDLSSNKISKSVRVDCEFGNLFAINEQFAWDTFNFPKIINIKTGEVVDSDESIDSGKQNSSIIHHIEKPPQIVFNRQTKQLAITGHERIEVLTPDDAFL